MKNTFYKYLFATISYYAIISFLLFPTIGVLVDKRYDIALFLFLSTLSLALLYIIFGFYWVFQKVTIDENGITIHYIFKRNKNYPWSKVISIREGNYDRNPSYDIKIDEKRADVYDSVDGVQIHLDRRKSIKKALEYYSNIKIENVKKSKKNK